MKINLLFKNLFLITLKDIKNIIFIVSIISLYFIFSIVALLLNDISSGGSRTGHNLFISLNTILFSSYVIFLTSKLFNKQKNNNLISLERRNGYKYKEIILSRLFIITIMIVSIFLFIILFNSIFYLISNKNILMQRYFWTSLQYYLFSSLLTFSISLFLISIFNFGISISISNLIIFIFFVLNLISGFLMISNISDDRFYENKNLFLKKNVEFENNQNFKNKVEKDNLSKKLLYEANSLINEIKSGDNYLNIFDEKIMKTYNLSPIELFIQGPLFWNEGFNIAENSEFKNEFPQFANLIKEINYFYKTNTTKIEESEFKSILQQDHGFDQKEYFEIISKNLNKANLNFKELKKAVKSSVDNFVYDALNSTLPFINLINNKYGIDYGKTAHNVEFQKEVLERYQDNWEQYYFYRYFSSNLVINNYIDTNAFSVFKDEQEKNNYYHFLNRLKTYVRFNPLVHVNLLFYGKTYSNMSEIQALYDRNEIFSQTLNVYINEDEITEIVNVNALYIGYSVLNVLILVGSTFIYYKRNYV
ncbi:hypothetical protein [Spiroplasma endosymbiont of Diplazon laetatorius]|uniref:hypothetical protein n=1 Tax=Spiroplasma endosymbiont of Diplazon laetatorius TaxID=3066322 RepID=UPI0030D2AF4B